MEKATDIKSSDTFPIPPYIDYKSHPLDHPVHELAASYSRRLMANNKKFIDEAIDFGPKSYHSSDQKIKEEIYKILSSYSDIDLSEIQLTVDEGDVEISGVVPERRLPGLTQSILDVGVRDLQNLLRAR